MAAFDAFTPNGRRACRPCSACCTHLPISAGAVGLRPKPAGTACPHVCATGCSIYPNRPKLCVDFCCVWLRDRSWAEAWRPDRSGLMCLREEIAPGLPAAAVYEILPGALQGPAAAEIIAALKRTTVAVAVVDSQERCECLLGERRIHPAEPGPPKPHFGGPQSGQPDRPDHHAATSY